MALSCLLQLALLAALACLAAAAKPAVTPPGVSVPPGNSILADPFVGVGVQIYKCVADPASGALSWTLNKARAKLYNTSGVHIGTHFFLSDPDGNGGRPTWGLFTSPKKKAFSSTVTGKVVGSVPTSNPADVSSLLLQATSHSGEGPLSLASYVTRTGAVGGAAPPDSACRRPGEIRPIPYSAAYTAYSQDTQVPASAVPPAIAAPAGLAPAASFFGTGFQQYRYNGSDWNFFNASAQLSYLPGSQVVGAHYLLPQKDAAGGQPSWQTFFPEPNLVTAKLLSSVSVSKDSVNWLLLEVTSTTPGDAAVRNVQRLSTRAGLPPTATPDDKEGDLFDSPYSAIYWVYAASA